MPSPFRAHPARNRAFLPLVLAGFAARAATYTWDGATALWNTAHWNPGPVTGASITTADTAVIGAGQVSFAQHDTYGNHATVATPLIQLNNGGTLASGGWYNALIGVNLNGGTLLANGGANANFGAFALKGSVTVTGSSPSFISLGTGSFNTVSVGTGGGGGSTTFTVADVTGSSAADLTISTVLNNLAGAPAAGLVKAGAGTLALTGDNIYTGTTDVQAGVLTLGRSGGTLANGAAVTVSGGTLDVANSDTVGLVTLTSGAISGAGTLTGSFNLQAGTVTAPLGGSSGLVKSGAGTVLLGGVNSYTGNTDVQAGTLRVTGGSISTSSRLDIGTVGNAAHFQLDSGASVTVGSQFVIGAHGSTGTATLGGGTLQVNGTIYLGGYGEGTGTGTITHTDGNVTSTAGVHFGGGGPNHGVYNLNGGVLTTTSVVKGGSGSATFNFNGGTLRPSAASATFLQGLSAANVRAGGGTLDTQAFNITVAQPLLHDPGLGSTPDGGLAKSGSGILTLSGGNTFTGNLVIQQGTVSTTGAFNTATPSATNIGNLTVSGRQIQVNSGATLSFGNNDPIGSVSTLQPVSFVVNGGTVTRNNFFATMPAITLQNGAQLTGGNGVNANFQSYNLMGTVTVGGTSGSSISSSGSSNLGVHLGQNNIEFAVGDTASATDLSVSVPLINKPGSLTASGLTKSGAGTLLLGAANGYTGPTVINGGTVVIGSGGSLSTSSAVSVNNGATLVFTRNDTWGIHTSNVSSPVTVNVGGTLASAGFYNTLVDPVLAGGQVVLNGGANVNYGAFAFKGTVTVNGAQATSISAIGGVNNTISIGPTTSAGATVFDVADATGSAAADLTVGVTLKNNFSSVELANGITKTGAGTMLLSGANTFTGAATVNNGTLVLANGGAIADTAPVVLANTAGATLQLNNSETIGSLAGGGASGGNVNLQGNTLTAGANGSSTTYSGTISGSGNVVKAGGGELTLDTTHAYSGKTTVTGGTLNVPTGNPQTFGANPGAFVADQVRLSGGTLRVSNASLSFNSNRGLTIGNTGVTAGTLLVEPGLTLSVSTPLNATEGNVTKAGAGAFNLTATATYNALTVAGGVYRQNAGVTTINTVSSGLQVGAVGAYELNGGTLRTDALTIAAGGSFTWGAATLAAKSTQGADGASDFSSGGYQVVRSGTTIGISGSLDTSTGSVLALHGSPSFYSNDGIRFTNILISGDLDLLSAGDALEVEINPYLLRPYSPSLGTGAIETGSIPLVVVDGNLAGTFDAFGSVVSEGAGFAEFAGAFTGIGDLTDNTWKLQYVQDVVNPVGFAPGSYDIVYFHYRVTGYVPEPESFGLMLAGALSLRYLRRRPASAEPAPTHAGKHRMRRW